jgi:hypothetical protein
MRTTASLLGRSGLAVLVGLVFAPACSDPPPEPPGLTCDERPDSHCDHPVDRLLVPRLRGVGLEPRDATAEELCRRMAIDLVGRGPTRDEQAACLGRTPGEIFDQFAATDEYVRTQRRAWGEIFGYDTITTWPTDLVELDRIVEQLYRDQISYADFVVAAVMHPAMESLHPGDSWTTATFSAFLGRTARSDEIAALRPFTEMWGVRSFCDRGMWWTEYQRQLAGGADEATAVFNANTTCANSKPEWLLNPCRCTPRDGFPGCVTSVLGQRIEVVAECVVPTNPYDAANHVRGVAYTPGADNTCPDGTTRPECADRDILPGGVLVPLVPAPPASAQLAAGVRGIGEAFVARADLWEAAIDREARRMIGWWQATFRHPDSDLPEVRTLLADLMRAGETPRVIQRLLMTSQLYVQPADTPVVVGVDPLTLPPWAAGPSKLLSGESWLETAGQGTGLVPQRCDFRFVTIGGYGTYFVDPRLVDTRPSSLDDVYYDGYSVNSMGRLSGCNSEIDRPEISNVGLAFNQADIARVLCGYGEEVTPAGWSGDLTEAATWLVANLWHRAPREGEVAQLVADMGVCLAEGATTGCDDEDAAARWMCQRMIDSLEFTTY